GQLAVAAEDAAAHVDLVDAGVALAGRVALLVGVLRRDDADAVRRAGGGAERATDALLEAVLVPVQTVAAAEARVHRPLVLGVLLGDGLPEQMPEGDPEALDGVGDGHVLKSSGLSREVGHETASEHRAMKGRETVAVLRTTPSADASARRFAAARAGQTSRSPTTRARPR